jgi:putative transcriptional regulator
MTPSHHPEPDELLAYASGTCEEWEALVVACHLTYCEECRTESALLDEVGGVLLGELEGGGGATRPDAAPREAPSAQPAAPSRSAFHVAIGLPRPLHAYFRDAAPKWRFLAPGVQHIPLSFSVGGVPARVVRFKPGFVVPEHSHQGLEMVLVLSGELRDSATAETFRAGDLSRREAGTGHAQEIIGPDPCVALVVSTRTIRPATLWGRILQSLTGV